MNEEVVRKLNAKPVGYVVRRNLRNGGVDYLRRNWRKPECPTRWSLYPGDAQVWVNARVPLAVSHQFNEAWKKDGWFSTCVVPIYADPRRVGNDAFTA